MRIAADPMLRHVADHAGGPIEDAWHATHAVLLEIGAHLSPATRELLADELDDVFAPAVLGKQQMLERGPALPRAVELTASVCRVLVEELSDEVLARLRAELPAGLAERFAPAAPELAPPILHRTTLAEGRPGQPHSVVTPNPHGAAKLSSGRPRRS